MVWLDVPRGVRDGTFALAESVTEPCARVHQEVVAERSEAREPMEQTENEVTRRLPVVVLVIANLFPLVGISVWGWRGGGVLAFYWLEMGSVIFWSSVKALFAERPQEYGDYVPLRGIPYKRGGIAFGDSAIAYPRNLATVFAGAALVVIWGAYGVLTFGTTGGSGPAWALDDSFTVTTVLLGAAVTFVGRGLAVWIDYLGERQYEGVTPGVMLRQPLGYYLGMGAVFAFGPTVLSADALYPVTTTLIAVHLALTIAAHYRAHNDRSRRLSDLLGDNVASWAAVDVPDEAPHFETETRPRTVLVAGVFRGLSYPRLVVAYVLFGLIAGGLLAGDAVWTALGLLSFTLGPLLAVSVGVTVLDYWIGYQHMEYRLYDRVVVGYDTWLDQPQWAVTYTDIAEVAEHQGLVGRICGTSTIILRPDDRRPIRLPRTRDSEQLHADLERRVC